MWKLSDDEQGEVLAWLDLLQREVTQKVFEWKKWNFVKWLFGDTEKPNLQNATDVLSNMKKIEHLWVLKIEKTIINEQLVEFLRDLNITPRYQVGRDEIFIVVDKAKLGDYRNIIASNNY